MACQAHKDTRAYLRQHLPSPEQVDAMSDAEIEAFVLGVFAYFVKCLVPVLEGLADDISKVQAALVEAFRPIMAGGNEALREQSEKG